MSSSLSLLGLYFYDETILDDMALPKDVDSEVMKNTILRECAELEILYSNPEFLKNAINIWSRAELQTWERLQEAFTIEYNPIWNVDGTETETEEHSNKSSTTSTNSINTSSSGSMQEDNSVTGYNSNTMQPESRVVNTSTNSQDTDSDGTVRSNDDGTITRTKVRGGNIGVTMSQQLLEKELEVRPKLNIYRYITEDFKNRFCLLIY